MGANISQQGDRHPGFCRPSAGNRFTHGFTPETEHVVVHKDKKKKHSKLATIKKKLSRSKRHSKSLDYSRAMRDLLSGWGSVRDVHTLVADYEATLALKELTQEANLARPHASTYAEDLGLLYDNKYFTDVNLVYKNTFFPVHRAILSLRCPFFRDLLARYPQHGGANIPVNIRTPGVSVKVFSALLRYLYTGQFHSQDKLDKNLNLLIQLADEFGTPNPLENDLKTLLETGIYHDATLVFTSSCQGDGGLETGGLHCTDGPLTPDPVYEARQLHRRSEMKCHRAILAARSPFFRNYLLRRDRVANASVAPSGNCDSHSRSLPTHPLNTPTCIILDEAVIPRRYARVLLHALYLDVVDLSCIVRSSVSMCSLSEVQAMVSGTRAHVTEAEEAMQIYQIAQFLDFPVLAQGCENILCDKLSVDNVTSVLDWSGEPHGSSWVHRQALNYVTEEFHALMTSPVLVELSKHYLLTAIKSDFLQASELEVLTAVLKWGEHQLIKRIEEREPNLLTHTTHSISRKGIKKRDLNDVELREILADLLPHVRIDHVLPRNHETLCSAIRRGLISQPPTHMLGDDNSHTSSSAAWVRGRFSGVYMKPRIFMPYYEEAKYILEENITQLDDSDNVRLRTVQFCGIPDTLYMLHDHGSPSMSGYYGNPAGCQGIPRVSPAPHSVDIIAGTIPVPDQDTVEAMIKRETELMCSKSAQQAFKLPAVHKRAVMYQLHLRVVREFGLPDSSAQILHKSHDFSAVQQQARVDERRHVSPRHSPAAWDFPPDRHAGSGTPTRGYPHSQTSNASLADGSSPPALSETIPDIAMPSSLPRRMRTEPHNMAAASGYTPPCRTHPSSSSPHIHTPYYVRTESQNPFYSRTDASERQSPFYSRTDVHEPPNPFYLRIDSNERQNPIYSRNEGGVGLPGEQGLDLDLGDGASHSGSRGSTFDRTRGGNSLYI